MFAEDCCLQCGKPGLNDGRIYCSSLCSSLDASPVPSPAPSPEPSSAPSSAFASPFLPPTFSTLSASSSSIPPLALDKTGALPSKSQPVVHMWYDSDEDALEDPAVKSPSSRPQTLQYARRPSSTNNRSTIPLLSTHGRRPSSSAQHLPGQTIPTPLSASASDLSSAPSSPASSVAPKSSSSAYHHAQDTLTQRKRNRASLPAYFSLLTSSSVRSAHPHLGTAPLNISNSTRTSRPSPSTPKLADPKVDGTHALAGASPSSAPLFGYGHGYGFGEHEFEFERGRRREPHSRSRKRSNSRSRERFRSPLGRAGAEEARGRRRTNEGHWMGTREFGYGMGRSGLREREQRRA